MDKDTRNTIQREFVLDAVNEMQNHPTAEEIYCHIVKKYKRISKATVYSNLKFLSEMGTIKRIELPGNPTRYDHIIVEHYHMRCRICGKIFDSNMEYDVNLVKKLKPLNGFIIEDYNFTLSGICIKCFKEGGI